jgi:beta-galactosidase
MRLRHLPLLLLLLAIPFAGQAQRARYNFNRGWLLETGDPADAAQTGFDDSSWKRVTLPHAWNEDSAYRVSIHDQPTGIAWYRKHFTLTAAPGNRVLIEFEGVRLAAEVYLNGHRLGLSENGVIAFGFDLTPFLVAGDNVLAVRTDNRWDYRERATNATVQWNNQNFYSNFGGINKNVWLHVTPAVHQTLPLYSSLGTTGQYIWADSFDLAAHSAVVHVESQVRNDSDTPVTLKLRAHLQELDGKAVASTDSAAITLAPHATQTLTTELPARGLHLWSWGYGYLYDVQTSLVVDGKTTDAVLTRTGFRKTEFRDGMLLLNGRVLQVHGYAARSTNEWPGLGTDVPPWISDFSNGFIVEDNGDLVRWMHVTPSKQDIESCDRVGLLESMPAGDAEGDPKGRQWQARVELMRDSIIYNRNNPSILFYESGNKGIIDEHMRDMLAVRNEFDPHGGRAIGSREMLASHTAEYGGEMLYINKSATKPLWAHEYNRDEGARKFWDDATAPFHKDSPLYNRNQDSFTLEDVLRWDDYFRARPGTGKRVSAGGVNISWIDENSHFRGDNNYRRSGEVDAMRIPKDAFFAHQVMWDGWVDPERPHIHINGHWNYPAGATRTIYIAANTASVELKLNGNSLGEKKPTHDFLFVFPDVTFAAGTLEATGYNAQHQPVTSTTLATTGAPATIRLTPHTGPGGIHADASDLALVDVEILDAQGHRVPTAFNMIHFSIEGPAEWRGGIAQGTSTPVPENAKPTDNHGLSATAPPPYLHYDNYILSRDLPVEGGINRVSIRSTEQPGTILLTAKADGLPNAHLQLVTHAEPQHNGLSTYDPAATLPVRLGRGPTPSTPSYRVSRIPVTITSATAGANASDASKSIDDNETTAWTNAIGSGANVSPDGLPPRNAVAAPKPVSAALDSAWIDYTLAQPAAPSQLELKLGSFRLRRYPLRITLDGVPVYEGTTPTSLGYVTLPLAAAKPGTHLRIALTAPPFNVQEQNTLVELNGTVDQAAPATISEPPVLSIFETEVYEPVRQ